MRFFLGDVRARERLTRATRGVDVIVHAAALKQVPACEYNPFEAVQTNVIGAENIVAAAIANDVPEVLALCTDKAVNPVNLYGATKLCAEKIFAQGNAYAGDSPARFASSATATSSAAAAASIPLFQRAGARGPPDDHRRAMTRFWITLEQAVALRARRARRMEGGEIFVPEDPQHARRPTSPRRWRPDAERRDHRHPARREAPRGADHRGRVAPRARPRRPLRDPARSSRFWRSERLPAAARSWRPRLPLFAATSNDEWLTPATSRRGSSDAIPVLD